MTTAHNNRITIKGSGRYLPGNPIPFDQIHDVLGPLDNAKPEIKAWLDNMNSVMKEILETKHYYYAIDPETRKYTEDNTSMAVKAARAAMADARITAAGIDLIVFGGAHMVQMPCPSVRIQEELGIERCAELSVAANCTSAYKAMLLAYEMLKSGRYRTALVVSSNMASAQLMAEHYNQKIAEKEDLFLRWYLCDGAGALVLQAGADDAAGFEVSNVYIESTGGRKPSAMHTNYPGYALNPVRVYESGMHHLKQMFQKQLREHFHEEGGTVFYHGLKRMIDGSGISLENLRYLLINMPSKHVVELIKEEVAALGICSRHIYSALGSMGYSGPPAAFIAVDKMLHEEKFSQGETVLSFVTEVSKFMQAGFELKYHAASKR